MAEFCPACWDALNETSDAKKKYALSRYLELCEGCGQYKRVVVAERRWWMIGSMLAEFFESFK